MADKVSRVQVVTVDGQKGSVDEADVSALVRSGGRVQTQEEISEAKLQKEYDAASTGQKIVGNIAGRVGGYGVPHPQVEAFATGLVGGATGDLGAGAARQIKEATEGHAAGEQYAETVKSLETAYPTTTTAGEVTGFGLGLAGGAATPVGAIGVAGEAVEQSAARALSGLATRGVAGRALATGGKLAARGAAEGALFGASEQIGQDMLEDKPINGEKLFAAAGHGALAGAAVGGVLGGGGSLLASGGRALVSGVSSRIGRVAELAGGAAAAKATEAEGAIAGGVAAPAERGAAVLEGAAGAEASVASPRALALSGPAARAEAEAGVAAATADAEARQTFAHGVEPAKPPALAVSDGVTEAVVREAPAAKGLSKALEDPNAAARGLAQDQAWKAAGGGFGLQSTKFVAKAQKYLPNGTRDVGEAMLKHGIIDVGAEKSVARATFDAAMGGRPKDMLPKAEAALETVGGKIGVITDASAARVAGAEIVRSLDSVIKGYESTAATRPIARSLRSFGVELLDSLGVVSDTSTVRVQDLLRERKALGQLVFDNANVLNTPVAKEAKQKLVSEMESLITRELDAASGKIPGELRTQYKALKQEYQALIIARDALEDSAARAEKKATFGATELALAAGGLASGNLLSAPVLAIGGKVLKERGNAAAAVLLARAADAGTFARLVRSVDEQVGKAAGGAFRLKPAAAATRAGARAPTSGKAQVEATRKEAQRIVDWAAKVKSNPERFRQQLADAAELIGERAGPKASGAYTNATLRALIYLTSYIPSKERRDPLDPRSTPPLTFDEADRLTRAAGYASNPSSVWKDFERGKVTPEGIRAAKELMPETYSEFQQRLYAHATEHMRRGERLSDAQRLRLDKLLGIPTSADLRPETLARLQRNFADQKSPDGGAPVQASSPAGNAPVNMPIQQSGFDAIEARKTG